MNKPDDKKNKEPIDEENLPSYDTITVDKLEEIHQKLDRYRPQEIIEQPEDNGNNGETPIEPYYPDDDTYDDIDLPDTPEVAGAKYSIEPDYPKNQDKEANQFRSFIGRSPVNSNTLRRDNLRHIVAMGLINDYEKIPTRTQTTAYISMMSLAEFQMSRGNEERGGFERKMQRSMLKREDVDVKQKMSNDTSSKKKKKFFGI